MEEYITKKSENLDKNVLVKFMKVMSEKDKNFFLSHDVIQKYINDFLAIVKYNVLAYIDNELSGWLGLIEVNPSLMILYEWHPLVIPCENENQIARNLLNKAFEVITDL